MQNKDRKVQHHQKRFWRRHKKPKIGRTSEVRTPATT